MATAPAHSASKAPPYSVASEKIVISALLRDPTLSNAVNKVITSADMFFRPEHGRLYNQIRAMINDNRDISVESICAALMSQGAELEQFVNSSVIDNAAAIQHAEQIAEKARQRRLIDTLSNILHDAYQCADGCNAVIKRAKRRLTELERDDKPAPHPSPSLPAHSVVAAPPARAAQRQRSGKK